MTVDAKKASLKAVHLRCWGGCWGSCRLRPLGCGVGRNRKTLETTRTHRDIYFYNLVYTYGHLHLSEFDWTNQKVSWCQSEALLLVACGCNITSKAVVLSEFVHAKAERDYGTWQALSHWHPGLGGCKLWLCGFCWHCHGVAIVVTTPIKMNLDTKNIHKWCFGNYLLSKMPKFRSLYFVLGGGSMKVNCLAVCSLGFFRWFRAASHIGWTKRRPSLSVRWSDGGSRAPQKQKRSGKSLLQRRNPAAASDKEGKPWKNVFCFSWLTESCFFFFSWGGGGGNRSADFFFVKWCNVRDWLNLFLVDVLSKPPLEHPWKSSKEKALKLRAQLRKCLDSSEPIRVIAIDHQPGSGKISGPPPPSFPIGSSFTWNYSPLWQRSEVFLLWTLCH